jgi:outer membrane receptor protein involved in Fe transport
VGSFGGAGLDVQADAATGERRLAVSISAERAENDFSFRNPVVPGGPIEVRTNADAASVHAALHAVSDPVHASLRFDRAERGVPGRAGTSLFERARADDRTWIATAGLDASRVEASASYGWRSLAYRASSADPESVQEVRELRLAGDVDLPAVPVTVGARLTRESVEGDLIEGAPGRVVGGVRVAAALSAGPFRVNPALSVDVSGDLVAASPELSAMWLVNSSTRIWGRVGQGFRLPTFGDLHFASQYQLRPNPGLQPERISFDSEAGASTRTSAGGILLKASATAWARHTNNPIVWLASSVAVWSPRNLGELWATGLELVVELEPAEPGRIGWRAQVAGTVQRSRVGFGSNRNPLPYEPRSIGRLSLEAWNGAIGSRVDLRHTGARTTGLAATRTLPAFTTVDVSARRSFAAGLFRLGLFLRVENVLDHRHQLIELFPEPGRHFTVRLEARRAHS